MPHPNLTVPRTARGADVRQQALLKLSTDVRDTAAFGGKPEKHTLAWRRGCVAACTPR